MDRYEVQKKFRELCSTEAISFSRMVNRKDPLVEEFLNMVSKDFPEVRQLFADDLGFGFACFLKGQRYVIDKLRMSK